MAVTKRDFYRVSVATSPRLYLMLSPQQKPQYSFPLQAPAEHGELVVMHHRYASGVPVVRQSVVETILPG